MKTPNKMSIELLIYFGEISDNWPNDLFGTNACKILESYW